VKGVPFEADGPDLAVRRHLDGCERRDHLIREGRGDTHRLADYPPSLNGQSVVPLHDLGPAAFYEPPDVLYRLRDAQPGGRVLRPWPCELELELLLRIADVGGTVTDVQWPYERLTVVPDVQERRAFRRAQPLVAVAGAVRGIEFSKIERDDVRAMGRVEQDVDAPAVG
jgi:hypothetical protein